MKRLTEQYNGLTYEEFKKQMEQSGTPFRTFSKDGEKFMLTQDLKLNRVNIAIENNIITTAYFG